MSLDDYVSTNNVKFYFDYQNGKYGYNTSSERGADTFSPFNSGETNIEGLPDGYWHYYTYTASTKFVIHFEQIPVNTYIQNVYTRGIVNLKGTNISNLLVYNSSGNQNANFAILCYNSLENYSTAGLVPVINNNVTINVAGYNYLFFICQIGEFRLMFT